MIVNITPRLGKYEFGKKLGHQADWMQAYISKIDIVKPDFDKLLHQKLFADKIRIGNSKAYISGTGGYHGLKKTFLYLLILLKHSRLISELIPVSLPHLPLHMKNIQNQDMGKLAF